MDQKRFGGYFLVTLMVINSSPQRQHQACLWFGLPLKIQNIYLFYVLHCS